MTVFANLPMSSADAANRRLEEVMEEMAGGHMPAILLFWQEFSGKMCRTVKAILREQDQRDLAADAEYVRDLAFECCWVIYERAPQWNNDDDLPWQWARPLLDSWVEDWLEQTGATGEGAMEAELEASALASDFEIFEEFRGGEEGIEAGIGDTDADIDEAGGADLGQADIEDEGDKSPDTLVPEFTISGESRSMGDRFDEALGLRPKN